MTTGSHADSGPGGLEAKGIHRRFHDGVGHVDAVDGVDLTVSPGEFVALMGPSGSGKSTLLQILGTLDTATAGTVEINGADVTQLSERERTDYRRDHIGFVFQSFHLVPSLTVIENVALSAVVARKRATWWHPWAHVLLDEVGMAEYADRMPAALSGGERQRVAVARAMFGEPRVILADEPTGNLDSASSAVVLQMVRAAVDAQPGTCGVLVTHDSQAASWADRVVALRDGRVVDELRLVDNGVAPDAAAEGGPADVDRVRSWLASAQS